MRRHPCSVLAAALVLTILAPAAPAQQPLTAREAAALRAIRSANARAVANLERTSSHRPYGDSDLPGDPSYRRGPVAPPPREVERPNFYAQPHTYYSGMRPGQHANANVGGGRGGHICVPNRGAFLSR
jgi:hypothetical protein